jgi:hypothetical protein
LVGTPIKLPRLVHCFVLAERIIRERPFNLAFKTQENSRLGERISSSDSDGISKSEQHYPPAFVPSIRLRLRTCSSTSTSYRRKTGRDRSRRSTASRGKQSPELFGRWLMRLISRQLICYETVDKSGR